MKKRTSQILELLTIEKKMEVTTLASYFKVSQVTIRKDLDYLESIGVIIRQHGYALLKNSDDLNSRIAYHYEKKKEIAKKAIGLVEDGDVIMIESGSCCAIFADELTKTRKDLTIITNSSFIAGYIENKADFQIILLGGIYQKDSKVLVGPLIKQAVENFYVDYFFIGTDGYRQNLGFTNRDQMRGQAVRDMANSANQVVVLTESEKFNQKGVFPLKLQDKIKIVITDNDLSEDVKNELTKHNISII